MTPNYEQIQDILSNMQSPYRAEDSHGMLCAMLIVNNSLQCKRWLDEICTQSEAGFSSLKKWCDGFLFGLALAGVKDLTHVPDDSMEILQDITTISQAADDEEEDEMNEVAYSDIVEYVRMGVLLINEEMHPMNRPQTIQ